MAKVKGARTSSSSSGENGAARFAQIRAEMPRRKPQNVTVTVLGAGVAGLTAAHELICRGFKVNVIERNIGQRPPWKWPDLPGGVPFSNQDVDVGGMARSQWATVPRRGVEEPASARPLWGLGDYPLLDKDGHFVYGGAGESYLAVRFDADENIVEPDTIRTWIAAQEKVQIVALSYENRAEQTTTETPPFTWGLARAVSRVKKLVDQLPGWSGSLPPTVMTVPLDAEEYKGAVARQFGQGAPPTYNFPGVLLRAHDGYKDEKDVLPGEHGFRFFPGFYWHLRDTMARTPIYDFSSPDAPKRTHRKVHDNLEEVEWQVIADPTRAVPTAFRRVKPTSVEEFLEQWQTLRNDLGFRDTDMLRFILRLGRFATSSRERRRAQYEHLSWWDFISLKRLDDLPVRPKPAERSGFGRRHEEDKADRGDTEERQAPRRASKVDVALQEQDAYDFPSAVWQRWKKMLGGRRSGQPIAYARLEKYFASLLEAERREHADDDDGSGLRLSPPNRLPYGLRFRRLLRHSPRALVAMDAPVTDAYTQGLLSIQLAIDQLGLNPRTDSTLNGPTSEAWFRHWKQYLKDEGVEFIAGEVTSISVVTGECEYIEVTTGRKVPIKGEDENDVHYVICTMDPTSVARVLVGESRAQPVSELRGLRKKFEEKWDEVRRLAEADASLAKLRDKLVDKAEAVWQATMRADPSPEKFAGRYREWVHEHGQDPQRLQKEGTAMDVRFQVLAGVQFYFDRPTAFELGHIYFPESPWGLMAMSQLQHWQGWRPRETGIYGNLSVVWGCWRKEDQGLGDFAIRRLIVAAQQAYPLRNIESVPEMVRDPWASPGQLSRHELAVQTRKQVAWCRGTDAQFRENLHVPTTKYYHVDDYLQFRGGKAAWNRCPYLINVTGDWDNRPPGEPWNPNRRRSRRRKLANEEGYRVYGDAVSLVFAGTHARTFTRMSTMEASNESARHAVNSVLAHLSMREEMQQLCEVMELIVKPKPQADKAGALKELLECITPLSGLRTHGLRFNIIGDIGHQVHLPRGRPSPRQSDGAVLETTWFGDFVRVRDPEDYEIPELEFFRQVDEELFFAQARGGRGDDGADDDYPTDDIRVRHRQDRRRVPHLFDLLRLDAIPDRIEEGGFSFEQAIRTLHGLAGALMQSLRGPEPLKAVLNLVDSLDGFYPPKKG